MNSFSSKPDKGHGFDSLQEALGNLTQSSVSASSSDVACSESLSLSAALEIIKHDGLKCWMLKQSLRTIISGLSSLGTLPAFPLYDEEESEMDFHAF